MSNEATAELASSINEVFLDRLRELLEGEPQGQPTWVTTGGPEGGINGSIAGLSAEQVSREIGGTTIAAHVEHERWALRLANDYFAGVAPTSDWSASWLVRSVDEPAWDALRQALRSEGETLLRNVETLQDWSKAEGFNGAFACYGHLAYHLGAIRQLRKLVV
ncbi:MAG: hypothetical protein KF813_01315 [Trueperaceae bacterium]|nr:hypothetical protein [Trueperaceae bacterium]